MRVTLVRDVLTSPAQDHSVRSTEHIEAEVTFLGDLKPNDTYAVYGDWRIAKAAPVVDPPSDKTYCVPCRNGEYNAPPEQHTPDPAEGVCIMSIPF